MKAVTLSCSPFARSSRHLTSPIRCPEYEMQHQAKLVSGPLTKADLYPRQQNRK